MIRGRNILTSTIRRIRTQTITDEQAGSSNSERRLQFPILEMKQKQTNAAQENDRNSVGELGSRRDEMQRQSLIRMSIDEDWCSVCPTIGNFKASIITLTTRIGYQKYWWRDGTPTMHMNSELMKISNSLHQSPIQRDRNAIKTMVRMFCSTAEAETVSGELYREMCAKFEYELELKGELEEKLTETKTKLLAGQGLLSPAGVMKLFEEEMAKRFIDEMFDDSGETIAPGCGANVKGKPFGQLPKRIQWRIIYERTEWKGKLSGEKSLKLMIEDVVKFPNDMVAFFISRSSYINETNIGEIAESLFELFRNKKTKKKFNKQRSGSIFVISDAEKITPEQCCLLVLISEMFHVYYRVI